MQHKADITIIGAGAVGLAIASQVARPGREVYILERNEKFGLEQSSRNSQVIHAGILYANGSLKEKLCIEGNRLLYELCDRNGIGCLKCGKLFIATDTDDVETLQELYDEGSNSGVQLKMLSHKEIKQMEPNLRVQAAFHVPATGIIDTYALMAYLLAEAQAKGAQIVYKTEVTGIEKLLEGYQVRVQDPSGDSSLNTEVMINCAGLYSDKIAEMAGIDAAEANYKIDWVKGEYYSVSGGKSHLISGLIYPVSLPSTIDIHVCFDIDRRLRLGPYLYPVDEISYAVDDSNRNTFLKSKIMNALPFIDTTDIEPESSGILAVRRIKGDGYRDFMIKHEIDRGLPGLINLIGIDSPGLTSSPAIAGYVAEMVNEIL